MHDLTELVKWSFEGFWRWLGFFFLVIAMGGAAAVIQSAQILETAEIAATYLRALVNNGVPQSDATLLTASYVSTLISEAVRAQKPRDPWEPTT